MKKQKLICYFYFSILLISLFFLYSTANSQNVFTDSLNRVVASSLPDSTKVDIINEVVFKYSNNFPHLTLQFSDIAIEKSISLNDSFRLSRSYNRKAVAFYFMGDYNRALDLYFMSLQISEKNNIPEYIATDFNNIGLVLLEESLYEEALKYFQKSKEIIELTNRKDLRAKILDNIGIVYYSLQQYDSAMFWFRQSITINKELDQKQTLASNIKNVGNVFLMKENLVLALTHYQLALQIHEEFDNKQEIASLLNKIGYVKVKINSFDEAEKSLIKAKHLISETKSKSLELENIKIYAELYELMGQNGKAIKYLNRYNEILDSIQLTDKRKNYEQLKALAEINEKVKDINLLRTINTIQTEKIRSQRIIQTGVVILLILSLAVLGLIVNALVTKIRTNRVLGSLVEERTRELKLAKEQAEQSDQLKTAFLENMSHEVRTPMNAIVGFSDLLISKKYEESERDELLKNISHSTIRLLNLIEKVSYLAQLENNDVTIRKKECRIDDMFFALNEKYSNRLIDCDLSISIGYTISEEIKNKSFVLPSKMVELMVDELLDNATKFTRSGNVQFGVHLNNEEFTFFVKDTGEGISPEHKDKVFDKFVKFIPSHCSICDGAGIGLTIVKKNLELIGGSIRIDSRKGEGTLVEFSVPYQA